MKILDTEAYISTLRDLTRQCHEVSVVVAGDSMSPFLVSQRDTIFFRQPDTPLAVGDMVFYQRLNGQFVVHRICRIRNGQLYIVGDSQQQVEGPVAPEQVFARVTRVRRKGKLIGPENFCWKFFRHVWIHMIPLRHFFMKAWYLCTRGPHPKQPD